MIGLMIFLCVVAAILLMGMIGDKDAANRRNYTYAFCTCLAAIILVVMKG